MNFSREEQNLAQATPVEPPAEARRRSIRPLFSMIPFFARYRMRAFAALVALLVASLATLAVPIAVRRMIDFGFSEEQLMLQDVARRIADVLVRGGGDVTPGLPESLLMRLNAVSPALASRALAGSDRKARQLLLQTLRSSKE